MIVTAVQCEICSKQHPMFYGDHAAMYRSAPVYAGIPDGWITLTDGNPQTQQAQHFCSKTCLSHWAGVVASALPQDDEKERPITIICRSLPDGTLRSLASGTVYQPVTAQATPACKMRRFKLIDGETAEEVEGVKWGNGWVTYETEKTATFSSWERFKERHEGCGITWIDQEVSADATK